MAIRATPTTFSGSRTRTAGGRVPTNLSLPSELVAELDAVAGPRNRSAFVEAAIRKALKRERLRIAWESVAGSWSGLGPPEWNEPGGVERWVRELRREETDPGPEEATR